MAIQERADELQNLHRKVIYCVVVSKGLDGFYRSAAGGAQDTRVRYVVSKEVQRLGTATEQEVPRRALLR